MAGDWPAFAGHAGQAITSSEDGLWQTLTDDRIRAVMPNLRDNLKRMPAS